MKITKNSLFFLFILFLSSLLFTRCSLHKVYELPDPDDWYSTNTINTNTITTAQTELTLLDSFDIKLFAQSLCFIETRGYTRKDFRRSPSGAVGWCQILPTTASFLWYSKLKRTDKFKVRMLNHRPTNFMLAVEYLLVCLDYGWYPPYWLAFCYHDGHNSIPKISGRGAWYAGEVVKEYNKNLEAINNTKAVDSGEILNGDLYADLRY